MKKRDWKRRAIKAEESVLRKLDTIDALEKEIGIWRGRVEIAENKAAQAFVDAKWNEWKRRANVAESELAVLRVQLIK